MRARPAVGPERPADPRAARAAPPPAAHLAATLDASAPTPLEEEEAGRQAQVLFEHKLYNG